MSNIDDRSAPAAGSTDKTLKTCDTGSTVDAAQPALLAKRESLKNIGRFAAYTAPAMLVLLKSDLASAHTRGRGNDHTPGHNNGNGANCDNPGLHLGFNNNHHSPC